MTLSFLGQRVARILTRPPELLYAFTRHWFLLVCCLILGSGAMWAVVVRQPAIYEGRAQLLVTKNDSILATLTESEQRAFRDRDMNAFLNAQVAILRSDSVLRKLILCTGFSWTQDPATAKDAEETSPSLQETLKEVTADVAEFLHLQAPNLSPDEANAMQTAIEDIKGRSGVYTDRQGTTIDLLVAGVDHESIKQELRCWIEAYKSHLAEMARETWDDFLAERGRTYDRQKDAAAHALQVFRDANPNVSEARRELLTEEAMLIQLELTDLRRREIDRVAPPPTATGTRGRTPEYQELLAEKNRLELELETMIARRFTERSSPVREVQARLDLVNRKIADHAAKMAEEELEAPVEDTSHQEEEERQTKLQRRTADLTAQLKGLWNEKNLITDKLKELTDLENRYNNAKEDYERFEDVKLMALHLLESPLNVQVSDEPAVDTEPIGLHPLAKLALGPLFGLAAGLIIAVLREVVCGKVRFKHDLIDDFGLPVVTVLPK